MKFEEAMSFLRQGKGIIREERGDGGHLKCTIDEMGEIEFVMGSYYMTIYDVMAHDWYVDEIDEEQNV